MTLKRETANPSGTCPICDLPLLPLSKNNSVKINSGAGWVNDSTMELVGFDNAVISFGVCPSCFLSVQLPRIDTNRLYGDKAVDVRAKHYAKEFSNAVYGAQSAVEQIGAAFRGATHEYDRFKKICVE